jgi:hypothetical protein
MVPESSSMTRGTAEWSIYEEIEIYRNIELAGNGFVEFKRSGSSEAVVLNLF